MTTSNNPELEKPSGGVVVTARGVLVKQRNKEIEMSHMVFIVGI